MKDQSPTAIYRDVAKRIVAKLKDNLTSMIDSGKAPDLYWKLEQAIIEAMKYAESSTYDRTIAQIEKIISDFEDNDGTPSQ